MDLIIVFLIIFGQQITIIITIPIHPKLVGFVSFYDIYKQVTGKAKKTDPTGKSLTTSGQF